MRVVTATDAINALGQEAVITHSNVNTWGVGVFQSVDAAAMQLYAMYRNSSADLSLASTATGEKMGKAAAVENQQYIMLGGIINF